MTWQGPIPDAESCCPFPALIGLRPAQELDRLARSQQPRGGRPGAPHVHVGLSLHRSYRARLAASPRGAAATHQNRVRSGCCCSKRPRLPGRG